MAPPDETALDQINTTYLAVFQGHPFHGAVEFPLLLESSRTTHHPMCAIAADRLFKVSGRQGR
jgi:hypothetical protein